MKKKNLLLPIATLAMMLSVGLAACTGGNNQSGGTSNASNPGSQPISGQSSQAQEKIVITAADGKTTLYLGQTVQLSASVDGVKWESKKPEIASVSDAGLVTAVAEGSTTISATKDGYTAGTITIKVQLEPIKVTAADNKTSLIIDEKVQLSADKEGVTWKSSDESIASVSTAGLVTALKAGSATISAEKAGFKTGSVAISVSRPPATATLHMEDAEHFAADGEWTSSTNPTEAPTYAKSNASDGTTCAHFGAGDIETLRFTSSKAVKAEICLTIGYYYSLDDVSQILAVKFNGQAVSYPAQAYEAEDTSNYTYKPISFGELDLIADTNVLEITMLENSSSRFPYMDDVLVYAAEPVTITLVPAPTKDPVTVNQESITVNEGKTAQITSSMTGLSFKSASESVATVDDQGVVTGVKVGTTTIAVSKDGFKTIRIPVTVTEAAGVIALSIADISGDIPTRTSRNLEAPYNYIIDEDNGGFPANTTGTISFTVAEAGTYNLYMRCRASGGYNSSTVDDLATCMEVKVNGTKLNVTGTVQGNSFTDYLLGEVTLAAGAGTLEIKCLTVVPTINMFRFIPKA